uniref:Titin n=1 Tax=Oryzias latipes TaxID=8090 RepID=A0A3P9IPF7_ORYLA
MYCISATNAVGKKETTIEIIILDKPGPPSGPIRFEEITTQSVTMSWDPPKYNGGCQISNYIVQKRNTTTTTWENVSINWARTTIKVTKLTTGTEYQFRIIYEFRVAAENIVGVGEPSLPSSYYKACDPKFKPSAPTYVNVIDSTKTSITVSWGKPLSDGGSEIQGYIVEVCKAEEEQWTMVTPPTGLRVNKYEIMKLTEGQEYKIQVCALNKLGVGEPLGLSGTIKPEEKFEPPQIHLHSELRKGITVKAGGSVRIHIPFKGRPAPEIMWMKDEGNLTEKAVIEKAVNFTQLSIDSCDRNDSGKYTLSLTNSSGCVSEFVSVKVLDTPGAPQNLVVKSIKKDSVTLEWDKPEHDGGSRIGGYLIEMLPKGTDKWGVATNTKTCDGTVTGLTAGAEYQFRIIAYNEKGKSEPRVLAAPVIASDMTMEPNINMQFNTYTVLAGKDLKLEFPVLGRPKPKVNWMKNGQPFKVTSRVNILNTASTTGIQITEACKDDFGKYSITANNAVGTVTEDLTVPPANVRITEVTKNSVSLVWQRPPYDGGSKITGYSLERREASNGRWVKANFTNIIELGFTVSGLSQDESYEFRVFAKNAVGSVSNPSLIAGPVTCVDACGELLTSI